MSMHILHILVHKHVNELRICGSPSAIETSCFKADGEPDFVFRINYQGLFWFLRWCKFSSTDRISRHLFFYDEQTIFSVMWRIWPKNFTKSLKLNKTKIYCLKISFLQNIIHLKPCRFAVRIFNQITR